MEIGDLVKDNSTKEFVLIVSKNPEYIDPSGSKYTWDFEVLSKDSFYYADADDLDSGIVEIDSNYELKSGTRPDGPGGSYDGTYNEDYEHVAGDANDLDECNGMTVNGSYGYYISNAFPWAMACYKGTLDSSFQK